MKRLNEQKFSFTYFSQISLGLATVLVTNYSCHFSFVLNFDEKNRDLKMVGEKKPVFLPPPPNEFLVFAWNLGLGPRNFMSWNIYSLANFWQIFFRPCTFQPLSIPFWKMKKAKKCKFGQKLHRFQKNWKNRKNLFFSFGAN